MKEIFSAGAADHGPDQLAPRSVWAQRLHQVFREGICRFDSSPPHPPRPASVSTRPLFSVDGPVPHRAPRSPTTPPFKNNISNPSHAA